jgi:hypothetical protein
VGSGTKMSGAAQALVQIEPRQAAVQAFRRG